MKERWLQVTAFSSPTEDLTRATGARVWFDIPRHEEKEAKKGAVVYGIE